MPPQKKHQAGAARNYITRTQAIRKLQISLADFRRLCIFKGIYPREPRSKKKANKGSSKPVTFYYAKDIQYLMHEPVLDKFRQHKIFARKLSRAIARNQLSEALQLDRNRPRYRLDHLVKERYPTFLDALRDLDDPLSMLFLFAQIPATDSISYKVTQDAERLCNQWMAYVAREGLLTKVFVSIKGVYYEAKVKGQTILWLVPFKFTQNMPDDIDFRVMLTFLEFYTTLVQFVLFKLYTEAGLVYPPEINQDKIKGVGGLSAYILKTQGAVQAAAAAAAASLSKESTEEPVDVASKVDMTKVQNANQEKEQDSSDSESEYEDADDNLDHFTVGAGSSEVNELAQPVAKEDKPLLFANKVFYVGREVPLDIIEFVVSAFGGKVISESALDEMIDNEDPEAPNKVDASSIDLSTVTHQICDRPSVPNRIPGRVYVQPQWVFDCVNKAELVSTADYVPGATLPPHLSPWGDDSGYNPEEEVEGDEEEDEEIVVAEGDEDQEDEEEDEEEDKDVVAAQKELEQESKGVYNKNNTNVNAKNKSKKRKPTEEEEAKELRKMMMSNRQRKLYNKIQGSADANKAREEELRKKRRKIDQVKKKLGK